MVERAISTSCKRVTWRAVQQITGLRCSPSDVGLHSANTWERKVVCAALRAQFCGPQRSHNAEITYIRTLRTRALDVADWLQCWGHAWVHGEEWARHMGHGEFGWKTAASRRWFRLFYQLETAGCPIQRRVRLADRPSEPLADGHKYDATGRRGKAQDPPPVSQYRLPPAARLWLAQAEAAVGIDDTDDEETETDAEVEALFAGLPEEAQPWWKSLSAVSPT